jgi:hypothetical protein
VDPAKNYVMNGKEVISGKQILEEGLFICPEPQVDNWYEAVQIVLAEEK